MVLVLGGAQRHLALRGDPGVLARGDVRCLDGGVAARIDGDVAARAERGLHIGDGRDAALGARQRLGVHIDIAARVERQIAIGGRKLAANVVDVLGSVELHAAGGAYLRLLGGYIGVRAGGGRARLDEIAIAALVTSFILMPSNAANLPESFLYFRGKPQEKQRQADALPQFSRTTPHHLIFPDISLVDSRGALAGDHE